ncbi:MAG: phospholipid carrier-dependent glycosyltransferase [Aggregatilineales bacterium]
MKLNRVFVPFLLVLFMIYVIGGMAIAPFHGDESTQIYMSRDYAYLFIERDLDRVRYQDPPLSSTEQHLRLLNGTVNKLLIGAMWHAAGFTVDDLNEQWDWGAGPEHNQANGHAPSSALLRVARLPSTLLLAASIPLIYILGALFNWRAGLLAAAYYTFNPALLLNGRRAMMEGSLIFFSLLTVLAGVSLLRARGGRLWGACLLLGAAAGLALASKHNAIFVVLPVFAVAGLVGAAQSAAPAARRAGVKRIAALIVAGLLALLIFYALNPAWWGDPFVRAHQVLDLRADLLAGQAQAFGGYASLRDQLEGFFRQAWIVVPQYYEAAGWEEFLSEQIDVYENAVWRGIRLGGTAAGALALIALSSYGVWRLVRGFTLPGLRLLVGTWAAVALLSTALLTPLEWQRYYLPAYPAIGLLAAIGLVELLDAARSRARRPPTPNAAAPSGD